MGHWAAAGTPAGTRRAITYSAYQWDDVNTGADFDVDESYYNWDAYVDQADFAAEGWDEHIGGTNINTFLDDKASFSETYLDNGWTWYDYGCTCDKANRMANVQIVLTHEIGHWICLGNDCTPSDCVMCPDCGCKLQTTADDDSGVIDLYGQR